VASFHGKNCSSGGKHGIVTEQRHCADVGTHARGFDGPCRGQKRDGIGQDRAEVELAARERRAPRCLDGGLKRLDMRLLIG
jgi:hypothetical protein